MRIFKPRGERAGAVSAPAAPLKKRIRRSGAPKPPAPARRLWDRSNERVLDLLRSIGFLGPSVLGVTVFFIAPFLVVVWYSVIRSPINPEFVGLDNFISVLQNYSFQTAAKNTAIFSILAVPLAVVLSLALSRQLFQPIQRLHKAIREVAHNNLDVYVSHEHNDELGQLADRFNDMLVALKRNQEQLLENQRERNEAQIRMLQAQLNPHFLCNTLDTMKWISKIHHVPQVADMSTNLADILRFCISPEEFVPLRRETEIVARYVEIQRIRLSGSFAFVLDIPPELEEALVPKMMLQPIVENALLHGLSGQPDGAVEVRARREGAVLRLTVLDNGVGLPPELEGPYACRDQEETRGHLGLYNVDTILRKHYGEQFGLCLENRPDGTGTMVTATLPLRYKEDASSC